MVKVRERNPKLTKDQKFYIDLTIPKDGDLIIVQQFIDFLAANIKINGEKGRAEQDFFLVDKRGKVEVTVNRRIPKRYLKYLTKQYLKKNGILEYFRILASSKNTYTVRYHRNRVEMDEAEEN